ncbi:MAG: hypothetical protein ACRD1T_25265 [Acidimicrobiia bacterium]|jgi:hypothetical protein
MVRRILIAGLVLTACSSASTTQPQTTSAEIPPATTSAATSLPADASSEDVATAFFVAWVDGDRPLMEALSESDALRQAEGLSDLAGEAWQFDHCEGAAGTVFCVWATSTDQLAIGVRNIDEPHLVTSVSLVDV